MVFFPQKSQVPFPFCKPFYTFLIFFLSENTLFWLQTDNARLLFNLHISCHFTFSWFSSMNLAKKMNRFPEAAYKSFTTSKMHEGNRLLTWSYASKTPGTDAVEDLLTSGSNTPQVPEILRQSLFFFAREGEFCK